MEVKNIYKAEYQVKNGFYILSLLYLCLDYITIEIKSMLDFQQKGEKFD